MKKLNVLTLAAASILMLGGLAGCGNNDAGKPDPDKPVEPDKPFEQKFVKLDVASPADHHELIKSLATTYNAERKAAKKDGIEVNMLDYGEGDVGTKVTDWESGPDLFAFASDQIKDFYAKGILSELPVASEMHVETTMLDSVQGFAKLAGKTLAYPFSADNTYYLYYDKSQINLEDVQSFETLFAKAAEKGKKVSYNLKTAFYGIGALFTYGARYNIEFNEEGQVTATTADFNTEKGLKAAKAIRSIVTNPNWVETETCPGAKKEAPIATVSGTWNAKAYKDELGDNFACTKIPTITVDGETAGLHAFLGGKLYGVNAKKDAKNVMAAHEFATFLTGKTAQRARYDAKSVAPTNKELAKAEDIIADPSIKAVDEQRTNSIPQTAVPGSIWGAYDTFYANLTAQIKLGEVTDEFLTTEMETLNKAITTL